MKYKLTIQPQGSKKNNPFPKFMYYAGILEDFKGLIVLFKTEDAGTVVRGCKGYKVGEYMDSWSISNFKECPDQSNPFDLNKVLEIPFPKFMISEPGRVVYFVRPGFGFQVNTACGNDPHYCTEWNMQNFEDITNSISVEI